MKDKQKRAPEKTVDEALRSWNNLNEFLAKANELSCGYALSKELAGKCRLAFVLRIHSRLNRQRACGERYELRRMVHEHGA